MEQNQQTSSDLPLPADQVEARREFLKKAGTFAATVPPAIALMLDVSATPARAQSTYVQPE